MKKGIVILFALLTLLSLAVLVACDNVGNEKVTYTVTFMDGDEVCYTREVGENTAVLYKPDEEAGRTFVGWFTDRELTEPFDGSHGVSADMTVYGKWDTEVFTVKFVDADGNILKEMTVEYGCDAVPPAEEEVPVPEGYEFQGWSDPYTYITSDMVIAAEYEKIPEKGNLVFFINDEEIYSVTDVTEGDPIGRYINEANAEVPKKLPGYVQFGSVWTDEEGNSVSSDAVFGGKDTALYAKLSFAESLDINRHDITDAQSAHTLRDGDFDFELQYMGNFMGAFGYSLSGTAYKDVDYTFTWYYNGDVLNAAEFDDNLKLMEHSLNFGAGDSLYFANAATEGAVGKLQLEEWNFTLNVGEYLGLFALKMTATPNENSGFRYLGSYERELKWDFKIIPADFELDYKHDLGSHEYDQDGYLVSADVFKDYLKEDDDVTFSVDGEEYSEEVLLKDAGVYYVAFRVSRDNYNDFTGTVVYEITPKPITVYAAVPENSEFYYGDTPSYDGFGYFAEGLLEGDVLDISDAEFGGFPASFGGAGDKYTVYFDGGVKNDNYKIEYGTDPLKDGKNVVTILKRPISITVKDAEAEYGAQLPAFTPKLYEGNGSMGFAPGEDFGNLVSPKSYKVDGWKSDGKNNVGEYKVTPVYSNYSGNYDIRPVQGTLTVVPANLIGYVSSEETQYRTVFRGNFTVTFPSLVGNVDENDYVLSQYEFTFKTEDYDTSAPAGSVFPVKGSAVARDPDNANYIIKLTDGDLTVVKALINVEVTPNYGVEGDFTFGTDSSEVLSAYNISANWPGGDTHFDALELTTNYEGGMDVGKYYVVAAQTKELDNYRLTFVKRVFELKQRAVKVTLRYDTIYYGDKFSDSYYLSEGSMVYGDKLEVSFETDYSAGKPIGTYPVGIASAKVNGSDSTDNYKISLSNETITVSPRSVTLSLTTTARIVAGEGWTGTITAADNLFAGDTVSATLTLKADAAGTYNYSAGAEGWTVETTFRNAGGEDVTANYAAGYAVTVTILSVTIEHTLMPDFATEYPADVFDFTVTYDGREHYVTVVLDETVAGNYSVEYSLSENGKYIDTVPVFSNSGTYKVYYKLTPNSETGDVEKGSYTLTILKRQLSLELEDREIVYGGAFEYGEVSGIPVDCTVSAAGYTQGSDVGKYPLTAALTENAENYELTYTDAILTVRARPVTVTVYDAEVVYGEAATLTYEVTDGSLYEGDKLYLYSDYAPGKEAGSSYPISVRDNSNYSISYSDENKAKVTVLKRELNVVISDITIKYGEVPEYKFEVSNLWYGDEGRITLKASSDYYNADTESFGNVGPYDITLSTTTLDNYTVPDNAKGRLTVEQLDITVLWYQVESDFTYDGTIQEVDITNENLDGTVQAVIESAGISLSYEKDGEYAEFIDAGLYTVTLSLGSNFNVLNPQFDFVIKKAVYTLSAAEEIITTYHHNKTLSQIAAPKDLSWLNPNEVPVPSKTEYAATVTNDNYYSEELISVPITVNKAEIVPTSVYTMEYTSGQAVIPDVIPAYYAEDSSVEIPRGTVSFGYDVDSFMPGTYAVTANLSENEYYSMTAATVYVKVAAVTLNGVKYTLEDALYNARLGSGDTITLLGNVDLSFTADEAIIKAIYGDSAYRTLKAGVTLILPSTDDAAGIGETTYLNKTELRYIDGIDSYINMKLTIPAGVEFIVNGSILVRGGLGNVTTGTNGHTTGNHSQIVNNGTVTAKSGAILDMKGFIKGAGTLYMESGSDLYSPFAVLDYRGGTNTVIAYKTGKIAPFRIFDMPNVQCKVIYEYGSELKAYFDLYANGSHNNMDKPVTIIGPSGGVGAIFNMQPGSVIEVSTEKHAYKEISLMTSETDSGRWATNDRHTLLLKGNIDIGSLKLEIKLSFISATVDMNEVLFPIPYLYNIIIGDGTTATTVNANARYKFMPGSALTVNQNATLNMGGELIFYREGYADDLTGFKEKKEYCKYPTALENKAAILTLNGGTLNVTGTLAANVNATEGGKLIMAAGAGNYLESKEGHSGSSSKEDAVLAGLFGSGGEMTMQTVAVTGTLNDGTAVSGGVTYTYSGGVWIY